MYFEIREDDSTLIAFQSFDPMLVFIFQLLQLFLWFLLAFLLILLLRLGCRLEASRLANEKELGIDEIEVLRLCSLPTERSERVFDSKSTT